VHYRLVNSALPSQIASFTPTALTDNPALTDYPATAFPAGHTSTGH